MGNIKAKTHLQKLGFSDKDKKNSKHDVIQKWTQKNIEKILSETIMKNNPHSYKISSVKWEHQVLYENGTYKAVVGFVDLLVEIEGSFYYGDTKKYETETRQVFIEVKTSIPSLGELIRQLRSYQAYSSNHSRAYLVVAPDETHKEILNEQGFYFYKYNDPTLLF
jgi:hypothetical protein